MKKGQFLELDLLIAITILIGGVLLVKSLYIHTFEAPQVDVYSQDAAQLLEEQLLRELDPSYLAWLQSVYPDIDENLSVARQITLFIIENELNLAENLTMQSLQGVIPDGYSHNVSIISNLDQYEVYSESTPIVHTAAQSRILLTGLEVGSPVVGFTGTVYLSRAQTTRSSYAYFGGFVGQGNISMIVDLPATTNPQEVYVEGDFHDNFTFFVNGYDCGEVIVPPNPDAFTAITQHTFGDDCTSAVIPNGNVIRIIFTGDDLDNKFVGGGFIRITYLYENPYEVQPLTQTYHFPDISGVFNLYDAIYIPGVLNEMNVRLHYDSNHSENNNTIFFAIGDTSLHRDNESTDEQIIFIDNSELQDNLTYEDFTNQTVPIRFGYENVSFELVLESISDSVLITDVSGSMGWEMTSSSNGERRNCDDVQINDDDSSRLSIAKCAGKDFADIIINESENRVGLVSYESTTDETLDLTNNLSDIFDEIGDGNPISGYAPGGYTCIACGIYDAAEMLIDQGDEDRLKFMVVMSDGEANRCRGGCTGTTAHDQAVDFARTAHEDYNITIFTVSFGGTGWQTMYDIAAVDNVSNFFNGSNATALREIYRQIAEEIVSAGRYDAQVISLRTNNNKSRLFGDSYIEYSYTPYEYLQEPGTMLISGEKYIFNTGEPCDATNDYFPQILGPIEGQVVSYSGSHWTEQLTVNGQSIFNLTNYGEVYQQLGDPFMIGLPVGMLNRGPNVYNLQLADAPGVTAECSPFNKLIYTAVLNSTITLNDIYPRAEGCVWNVSFPTENRTINIPADYAGTNTCTYQIDNTNDYEDDDAWQVIGYLLFSSYDIEPAGGEGVLDIDFTEHDLSPNIEEIQDVPYMWGPAILEVVVWQ